jgi:hypothetical protein
MKNIKLLSLVVLALGAVACDPYDDEEGGTPNIVTAGAANIPDGVDAVVGAAAGDAWTVADVPCGGVVDDDDVVQNPGAFDNSYFYVTFDRQIDGSLVQTGVDDCTPVAGSLTITPAPASGLSWYTCYSPSSGSPNEGGSIVIYQAAEGGSSGWGEFEYLPQATYTVVGEVAGRAINLTVTPDAATCAP